MANKRQKQDQLAQSDRFIAELKQSINKQLDLIDELKRAGGDVAKDEELLDTLIPMLRAMLDHRRAILMQITGRAWGQTTLLNRAEDGVARRVAHLAEDGAARFTAGRVVLGFIAARLRSRQPSITSPLAIGLQLVVWTAPRNCAAVAQARGPALASHNPGQGCSSRSSSFKRSSETRAAATRRSSGL